jgi:hypothetical protein
MPRLGVTDAQFIAAWKDLQSASKVGRHFNMSDRAAHDRKRRIERNHGIILPVFDPRRPQYNTHISENRAIATYTIQDGTILIGSDAHIWPGPLTTMQRAFVAFASKLKPKAIIANGDFVDGARTSRWPHGSWTDEKHKPSVRQELEAVQDYMDKVVKAAPAARRFWTLGNHDARFESRLVQAAPEYSGVHGTSLKDHFPEWIPCWRVDVNSDVVVRHRELGGEHADHRNVQSAGKSVVSGHDHRANVTPYHDYTGTRWGVRCGYMADSPTDSQFVHYLEAREPNWQPAFVVLTFKGGRLLWPELCVKHDDGHVEFRGEVIKV